MRALTLTVFFVVASTLPALFVGGDTARSRATVMQNEATSASSDPVYLANIAWDRHYATA